MAKHQTRCLPGMVAGAVQWTFFPFSQGKGLQTWRRERTRVEPPNEKVMDGLQNDFVIISWEGRDTASPTRELDPFLPRSALQDDALTGPSKGDCAHRLTVATEVICAPLQGPLVCALATSAADSHSGTGSMSASPLMASWRNLPGLCTQSWSMRCVCVISRWTVGRKPQGSAHGWDAKHTDVRSTPTAMGRWHKQQWSCWKNSFPTDEAGTNWEFLGGRCPVIGVWHQQLKLCVIFQSSV